MERVRGRDQFKSRTGAKPKDTGRPRQIHLTTYVRSEGREIGEENQNDQREHPPEDADRDQK